jgi:hypothetical protein
MVRVGHVARMGGTDVYIESYSGILKWRGLLEGPLHRRGDNINTDPKYSVDFTMFIPRNAKYFSLNVVSIYDRHSETYELCHISEGFTNSLSGRWRWAERCVLTRVIACHVIAGGMGQLISPAAKWHTDSLLSVEVAVVCVRLFSRRRFRVVAAG